MIDNRHCKECEQELSEFEIATAIEICRECRFRATKEKHGSAQAELDQIREKARERRWKFMEKKKAEGSRQFSAIISSETYNTMCGIRDSAQLAGKPTSFGEIIEKALLCYNETIIKSSIDTVGVSSHEIANQDKSVPELPTVGNLSEIQDQSQKHSDPNDLPTSEPKCTPGVHLPKAETTEKQINEAQGSLFDADQDQAPENASGVDLSTIPKRGTPEYSDWLFDKIDSLKRAGMSSIKIERKFNDDGVKPASIKKKKFNRGMADTFYKHRLKKMGFKWDKDLKQPVPIEK